MKYDETIFIKDIQFNRKYSVSKYINKTNAHCTNILINKTNRKKKFNYIQKCQFILFVKKWDKSGDILIKFWWNVKFYEKNQYGKH